MSKCKSCGVNLKKKLTSMDYRGLLNGNWVADCDNNSLYISTLNLKHTQKIHEDEFSGVSSCDNKNHVTIFFKNNEE